MPDRSSSTDLLRQLANRSPEHATIVHLLGDRLIQVVVDTIVAELDRLTEPEPAAEPKPAPESDPAVEPEPAAESVR